MIVYFSLKFAYFSLKLPPTSQKKFRDVYELSNEKSGNEKRQKNFVFCKLSIKDQWFFTQLYIYNNGNNKDTPL